MLQPEKSPVPNASQPPRAGRQISGDDIELAPIPQSRRVASHDARFPETTVSEVELSKSPTSQSRRFPKLLTAGALLAALAAGIWHFGVGAPSEGGHPNWNLVVAAANASSATGANVLTHRDATGAFRQAPSIVLSSMDADHVTTQLIQGALLNNDLESANAALRSAQGVAVGAVVSPDQRKSLTPSQNTRMLTAIRDGSSKFFHLKVFDCCAEDGDVVDILVNGEPFATVPLTHQGTTLSLPLTPGTTTVTLRGVHDGGGGITVSFQSSQGDYFSQAIGVGEEYHVGVVVK